MRRWPLLLAMVTLALTACAGPDTITLTPPAPDPAARRGVTVDGLGRAMGKPDALRVTIGVGVTRPTVQAALDSANAAAGALLKALRDHGVAERDIATRDFGINPEVRDPEGSGPTGYTARNTVEAKLHDLSRVGEVLTAAIQAGGDAARVEGIEFMLADNAALLQQARDTAFADARAKAEQYARLAQRPLGALISVSEVTAAPPIPLQPRIEAEASPAAPVPIAPGQQEVTVTITAHWALK